MHCSRSATLSALMILMFAPYGAKGHYWFGHPSTRFGSFGSNLHAPYAHRGPRSAAPRHWLTDSFNDDALYAHSGQTSTGPRHQFADVFHDNSMPSYTQRPCPQYQPLTVSKWHETDYGQFIAHVSLPNVLHDHHRTWLGEDGFTVHVQAAREIPVQGRRCMPHGVRTSADGRYEIMMQELRVPHDGNGKGATVRQIHNGLELRVPKVVSPAPQAATPMQQASSNDFSSVLEAGVPKGQHAALPSSVTSLHSPRKPSMELPYPSDGIEVTSEPFPEIQKNADAAEGWWDNRGEFHTY